MTRPSQLSRGAIAFALTAMLSYASVTDAVADAGSKHPETERAAQPADTHITVTDDFGRNVTVKYPPQRIVSLAPGGTAMLLAAGAGSQLVGTIEYSGQPASEDSLPKIGSLEAIDMERLITLRPDVVVVWPDGNSPAEIATIERLGIPVYRQESYTLDGIGDSLRRLGKLTGTSSAADRAAGGVETKLASLRKEYAQVSRPPTVLLEVWNQPLYTVGGKELISDAVRVCGARNVFADLRQPAPAIGIEAVLARNPAIIIAVAPPGRGASWLAQWRRFPSLQAVRTGRLIAFEDQRLSGLGPSIVDATAALCGKIAALKAQPERK
ncbi:MAG: cobalamin-binding protein [Steroidobacteraceae bacterium]